MSANMRAFRKERTHAEQLEKESAMSNGLISKSNSAVDWGIAELSTVAVSPAAILIAEMRSSVENGAVAAQTVGLASQKMMRIADGLAPVCKRALAKQKWANVKSREFVTKLRSGSSI